MGRMARVLPRLGRATHGTRKIAVVLDPPSRTDTENGVQDPCAGPSNFLRHLPSLSRRLMMVT